MNNSNSKLTAAQLYLLIGLAMLSAPADKMDECCDENFNVPANEGKWTDVYNRLREKGILDENFNLTAYGLHRFHKSQSEGVNFERLAQRNPNVAVAMLAAAKNAIIAHQEAGYEFSEKAQGLFTEVSTDLAFVAMPETV